MSRIATIVTDRGTIFLNHDSQAADRPLHLVVDRPGYAAIGIRLEFAEFQQLVTAAVKAGQETTDGA